MNFSFLIDKLDVTPTMYLSPLNVAMAGPPESPNQTLASYGNVLT